MSQQNKPPSQRQLQVGEEIRHLLSDLFMREDFYILGSNQDINVTVSEVRVSPDLHNATVYTMPLAGKDKKLTIESLRYYSSQIRKTIAGKMRLRHFPTLDFRLDESFEEAHKISSLLEDPRIKRDLT